MKKGLQIIAPADPPLEDQELANLLPDCQPYCFVGSYEFKSYRPGSFPYFEIGKPT